MKVGHRTQLIFASALALVFCASGVGLTVVGSHKYAESRWFVAGAKSAAGKVVDFEIFHMPGTDAKEDIHYAIVLYETGDGREIRFRGPSKDGLVRLRMDDEVRVLYYPDDPGHARVDSFMGLWFAATMLCVVGCGAIVIPPLTLWQAWRWVRRQEEAAGERQPAP